MKWIDYFGYVVRHKYYVFIAGRKMKVSLWRLVKHDWSKFLPAEWGPYMRFFYGEKTDKAHADFHRAFLHHWHHNDHHWEHWIRIKDGAPQPLPMSNKAVAEMVADWAGAGRAITGRWELLDWYYMNYDKILLHDATRYWVDVHIKNLSETLCATRA